MKLQSIINKGLRVRTMNTEITTLIERKIELRKDRWIIWNVGMNVDEDSEL